MILQIRHRLTSSKVIEKTKMVEGRETHWTIEISWSVEWGCSHGGGAMERCLGFGGMAKQFVSGGVVANRGEVGREAGGWGTPGEPGE